MKTTKKEFKKAFEDLLVSMGISVNEPQVKSALDKMARHSRNRSGSVEWDIDNDLGNALCFYNEYQQQSTFNRDTYNNNR